MKKKILSLAMAAVLILSASSPASAKTYYNMKYNGMDDRQTSVIDNIRKSIATIGLDDESFSVQSTNDFNGDGKKERVKLVRQISSDYKKSTISLSIKGKRQLKLNLGNSISSEYVDFDTVKLDSKVIAILTYGDNDMADGGLRIYQWNKDDTLKEIIKCSAKGYLGAFVSNDKGSKNEHLYISDSVQIYLGDKKWPAAAPKKYIKWKKHENTSVTKTVYKKYNFKKGKLTKTGSDTFYRIGMSYD